MGNKKEKRGAAGYVCVWHFADNQRGENNE
jgi:hypothetical protein